GEGERRPAAWPATRARAMNYTCGHCVQFSRGGQKEMAEPITLAQGKGTTAVLLPRYANRHGCITGATGTGKTVTLQVLAEAFSRLGTPVFVSDVKGDLSGISQAGEPSPKLLERLKRLGIEQPQWAGCP